MPKIISVGTAEAAYQYNQLEAKDFARALFTAGRGYLERMLDVFDNAEIQTRRFVHPREWFEKNKSLEERAASYVESSLLLTKQAVTECINNYGGEYSDFDHIIFVSSTGLATPSIDAVLINDLKLDVHLKRTPIWGLGCAGGAAGLSRAFEYAKASPKSAVLLIAVEICSHAFHREDYSKSNLVSTALFADGAAAVVVAGEEHKLHQSSNVELLSTLSTIYYDSLDVMGWEIVRDGFKAIFSRDIPSIVRSRVKSNIEELLSDYDLTVRDLRHYAVHPGGPKVLNEYEASLGLKHGAFSHSRNVLRRYGNMSSPTVLYVLKEIMESGEMKRNEYGIISALGPGFSSELLLFKTV